MPVSYSNAAFSPILQQLQGRMQHQLQLAHDVKDCLQQILQAMPHNKLDVWDVLDILQFPLHELKHNTDGCLAIPASVGATYFKQPSLPRRLWCITSCMHSKAINIHSNKCCISCITMYRDCMYNCMHCKIHYKIEITSRMSLNACFLFRVQLFHLSSNICKVGCNACCSLPMTSRIVCNKCCKPCLTINSTCWICWICCNAHYMNLNTTHMDVLQYPQAWVQRILHNLHFLEGYVALHLACIQKQSTSTRTSVVFHASHCIEIACNNCMHCKIHYKIEITSRMSLKACFFFECSILTCPPTTARLDATPVAAFQWRQGLFATNVASHASQ